MSGRLGSTSCSRAWGTPEGGQPAGGAAARTGPRQALAPSTAREERGAALLSRGPRGTYNPVLFGGEEKGLQPGGGWPLCPATVMAMAKAGTQRQFLSGCRAPGEPPTAVLSPPSSLPPPPHEAPSGQTLHHPHPRQRRAEPVPRNYGATVTDQNHDGKDLVIPATARRADTDHVR